MSTQNKNSSSQKKIVKKVIKKPANNGSKKAVVKTMPTKTVKVIKKPIKPVIKSVEKKEPIKIEKNKEKKPKVKKTLKNKILVVLLSIMIGIFGLITSSILFIIIAAPDFKEENLYSAASSILLDKYGNEYAKLGGEKRELVTYEELPDVLIDAIIATEDSRFFQHNGFDAPRFIKATMGQLLGKSGAGGGSTITMQVSKNSFTGKESEGIEGIIRKFTDIYLSMFKIEKNYTKEQIIEFYVNAPFLGSNSYGVEEIAQTYFGKSIRDVSLVEAAVIAGLFQAPGAYNPYYNPDSTNKRKNTVLNLMYRHGYITKEERDIAQQIDVTNLLFPKKESSNKYQAFIDTVVQEVMDREKINPAKVSMIIYTTMDPKAQDVVNDVENGKTITFVNDVVELGIAVTSVKDGSIVAIGAGRNKTGELTMNMATQVSRHPGSTAKPYMVYGPGIEMKKWSTGQTFFDEEWRYSNGAKLKNADGKYNGIMTLRRALATSRNIPAIQGFQQLENRKVVEFAESLGITLEIGQNGETFESAAIGGFEGVSPLIQSAAYASFARGGYYIEPYSYTKIVYRDTEKVINRKYTKTKVMEESTAFMINMVLKNAVENGLIGSVSVSGTELAGKTGTSTFDSKFRSKVGLPSNSIMDSWVVMYSSDYAIAQWYGYKEMTKEMVQEKQYLTSSTAIKARKAIAKELTTKIMAKDASFSKPSSVSKVEIELETIPIQRPSAYTPSDMRSSEWFIKGTEPSDVSIRYNQLDNVSNLKYTVEAVSGAIKLSWDAYLPNAINSTWLESYFKDNYASFATKYYNRRISYNQNNIGNIQYHVYLKNSDGSLKSIGQTAATNFTYTSLYPNGLTFVVKSEYSIFKANASTGTAVTINTSNIPVNPDTPSSSDTPSSTTIDVKLRGNSSITVPKGTGTYTDPIDPINVVEDGVNVTNKATITSAFYKNDTVITAIDLSAPGTYKIIYKIVYNAKTYNQTRTIIVSE